MLFQVEGTQVYLLASIHSLPQNNNHINPEILRAYQQSEICVFEDDHKNQRTQPPPTHHDDGTQRIWYQALLKINSIARDNGFLFSSGIEETIFEKAQNDKKKIEFLDNENSNNAYAFAPIQEQTELLALANNNPEEVVNFLNGIYTAWRIWNTIALTEALETQFARFPEIYSRLHTARNQVWMPKILAIITNGSPALIIAGAFHFVGTEGICHQTHQHNFTLLEVGAEKV